MRKQEGRRETPISCMDNVRKKDGITHVNDVLVVASLELSEKGLLVEVLELSQVLGCTEL